jgi:hypothetical protein
VRLGHGRCFDDDDADRSAGVATNQQEVRHDLTMILYHFTAHNGCAAAGSSVLVEATRPLSRRRSAKLLKGGNIAMARQSTGGRA